MARTRFAPAIAASALALLAAPLGSGVGAAADDADFRLSC